MPDREGVQPVTGGPSEAAVTTTAREMARAFGYSEPGTIARRCAARIEARIRADQTQRMPGGEAAQNALAQAAVHLRREFGATTHAE